VTQIPFDRINSLEITDEAPNTCVCIVSPLSTVEIKSGEAKQQDLIILGLQDPHVFRKAVLALKNYYHPPEASLTQAMAIVERDTQSTSDNVTSLLREVRDELRLQNMNRRS
jgi:hypothetical protein